MTARRTDPGAQGFAYDTPDEAVSAWCGALGTIETEAVPWHSIAGRVLAEPIVLDRPSPACDVSAMDGYAIPSIGETPCTLEIQAEVRTGERAPEMPRNAAVRVFTGAMVPAGAFAVLPREQVVENADTIDLPARLGIRAGQHIRRAGENGAAGITLCDPGRLITPPVLSAIASSGHGQRVTVHRRLRAGVLVTGDEVRDIKDAPAPWEIRDSNGPALTGLLSGIPFIESVEHRHAHDDLAAIRDSALELLDRCDVLLLTGGVSVGDYDFVPSVLDEIGARTVFHSLPIRPGKPVLGAVSGTGQPIIGLPGNPVSVMVTARRLALPAMRRVAGIRGASTDYEFRDVESELRAPKSLTWFPLAEELEDGRVSPVASKGSGDWVSATRSAGFLEVPPGEAVTGRRKFYRWHGPR
ncbi:MAG: molybdopterin molybdotransferase MoeA [Phycisphaerales bacterium]